MARRTLIVAGLVLASAGFTSAAHAAPAPAHAAPPAAYAAPAPAVTTSAVAPRAGAPYPAAGVCVDTTGTLGVAACRRITAVLAADEKATTDQIAVAVVPTTGGASIASWATGLFNAWGVGRAGTDNGVLLVVALNRKLRLVTGDGMRTRLPDWQASEIVGGTITPLLRDGRPAEAVYAGLDEVRRAIGHRVDSGNALLPPGTVLPTAAADPFVSSSSDEEDEEDGGSGGGAALWILLVLAVVVVGVIQAVRGYGDGGGGYGGSGDSGDSYRSRRSSRSFSSSSRSSSSSSSSRSSRSSSSRRSGFGGGRSSGGGASGSW